MSIFLDHSEALSEAIQARDLEKAKSLLKSGADPNRLLLNEVAPFHLAAKVSSSFVNLMLLFGGNPNVPDVDGITPCHVAAQWGKADCLNLLLHNGGDLLLTDERGRDLKWFAQDNEFCMSILEEHFADMMEKRERITCNSLMDSKVENNISVQVMQPIHSSRIRMDIPCTESTQRIALHKENFPPLQCSRSSKGPSLKQYSDCNITPVKSGIREMRNCVLDATSPDNCYIVLKSSENKRISLNETVKVLSHRNQTMSSEDNSNPTFCNKVESSNCVSRQLFPAEGNLAIHEPYQSDTQVGRSNISIETCSDESDFTLADSTVPLQESIEKNASVSYVQPCQRFGPVCSSNACNSVNDRASSEESDFTLTDSTVPVEESIENSLSELFLNCKTKESNVMPGDLSAGDAGTVNSTFFHPTCDGRNEDNVQAQECWNPVQHTISSCNISTSGSMDHKNGSESLTESDKPLENSARQDPGKVVYETNGYSLIEVASSPSASILSVEEGDITVPLQLSCSIDNSLNDTTILYDWKLVSNCSCMEEVDCTYHSQDASTSLPAHIENMGDDELRQNLLNHGFTPGPIKHGRQVYKKRLHLLEQGLASNPAQDRPELKYSRELTSVLLGEALDKAVIDDDFNLRKEFDDPQADQCYRGWAAKDSFNYLLLDPRVTKNLPERAKSFSDAETLKIFAGAVFYIGKGKKSRPYAHFKEALHNVKVPLNGELSLKCVAPVHTPSVEPASLDLAVYSFETSGAHNTEASGRTMF